MADQQTAGPAHQAIGLEEWVRRSIAEDNRIFGPAENLEAQRGRAISYWEDPFDCETPEEAAQIEASYGED